MATVQAAVIADRRSGRSLSDAVVVSQERQLSAVSFGSHRPILIALRERQRQSR